jgi:hypothetical protein
MRVKFELLDRYLLDGVPDKATVVTALLSEPEPPDAVRPYLEGLRLLGARTPDLALIAVRLAAIGKTADDAHVVELRNLVERARRGGADGSAARVAFARALASFDGE